MNRVALLTSMTLLISFSASAVDVLPVKCRYFGATIETPLGKLRDQTCTNQNRETIQWLLNEQLLFSGDESFAFQTMDDRKSLVIVDGPSDRNQGCPSSLRLIDLTGTKPHVYAFGIKNACAEYHWASWGKKRSVIAIKDNIRFTYSKGKLTPPPDDFGDGTPLSRRFPEDGKLLRMWPFVEELPVP